ncbi:MAG: amidohydrolase family protein [Microbacteriaceae bacterium]
MPDRATAARHRCAGLRADRCIPDSPDRRDAAGNDPEERVMIDLSIVGGTVVTTDGETPLDVHVDGGVIVALTGPHSAAALTARETIDASGLHVLPGCVEPHAHLGLGDGAEDWRTETAAAAIGGVTTVFNYVMGASSYFEQVPAEHEAAAGRTHVDYALHVVPCTRNHLDELDRYVTELGVTSFKFFMSFRADEGAYLGIEGTDDGYLYDYLQRVARHPGAIANIHAENIEVVWRLREAAKAAGEDGHAAWNRSRPGFVEAEATTRAAAFGLETGAPVYIVHTSAGETVGAAQRARELRPTGAPPLHLETCAHYLTHTEDTDLGMIAKANPPLRSAADTERLWAAVADGTIQTIGSDHSPRHRSKKTGTVWRSPAGIAGIGAQLVVLLSEGHHRRGVPLSRIVELTSTNPAKIFGVYPQKGTIAVGSDADLALVALDETRVVEPDSFGGRAEYNLYERTAMTGWPVSTILRGTVVMRDGAIVAEPGIGSYLFRAAS